MIVNVNNSYKVLATVPGITQQDAHSGINGIFIILCHLLDYQLWDLPPRGPTLTLICCLPECPNTRHLGFDPMSSPLWITFWHTSLVSLEALSLPAHQKKFSSIFLDVSQ